MSLLFNTSQSHRRKRLLQQQLQTWIIRGLLILLFWACYQFGKMQSNATQTLTGSAIEELSASKLSLEKEVVNLRADLITTQSKLTDLTKQYGNDVGDMDLIALNQLIQDRIDHGVTLQRLKQVIAATTNVRNCSAPDVKRFMVLTGPAPKGVVSKATFGSGLIVVMGEGDGEINAKGGRETWYDPQKPVRLAINVKGADPVYKEGLLPIEHNIIRAGTEYRLMVSSGSRSYAEVTVEQCAYP